MKPVSWTHSYLKAWPFLQVTHLTGYSGIIHWERLKTRSTCLFTFHVTSDGQPLWENHWTSRSVKCLSFHTKKLQFILFLSTRDSVCLSTLYQEAGGEFWKRWPKEKTISAHEMFGKTWHLSAFRVKLCLDLSWVCCWCFFIVKV